MNMLYPLTPKVDAIVREMHNKLSFSGYTGHELDDLRRFVVWFGNELSLNAKFQACRLSTGWTKPTLEVIFEKSYLTAQDVRYKKHWELVATLPLYQDITSEMIARLNRSQLRVIK